MKSVGTVVIWILCVVLLAWGILVTVGNGSRSIKWDAKMNEAEAVMERAKQTQQAQEYSQSLLSVIENLAHENTLLCERDAKALRVMAEFEEENRRLTHALGDAVEHLAAQQTEINDLIDQNDQLSYKMGVLERSLSTAEEGEFLLSQAFVVSMESAARSQEELLKLINENSQLKYEVKELKRSLAVGVEDAEIVIPFPPLQ